MKRSIMLAAAAAALAAAPAAWAEEHQDQPHQEHGGQPHGQPQGQRGGNPQGQRGGNGQVHGPPQGQAPHVNGQPQGQGPGPNPGQNRFGSGGGAGDQRFGSGGGAGKVTFAQHGPGQIEPRFDRNRDPGHWTQNRHDWRGAHGGWDRGAAWRGKGDWWRGRAEFRLYTGPRVGFWFVPGVGYYRVPPQYWGRHWAYGDYLPAFFWQYTVNDWWAYGLPAPPPGCAWVWIDGGVALVDLTDGYILDIEYGLW